MPLSDKGLPKNRTRRANELVCANRAFGRCGFFRNLFNNLRVLSGSKLKQGDLTPRLPLYISTFVVVISSLWVATMTIEDPFFTLNVLTLTVLGFFLSFILRLLKVDRSVLVVPVVALWVLIVLYTLANRFRPSFFIPLNATVELDLVVGSLLVWLVVFRSFSLINDYDLLFCIIPGVALFGVMGVHNINPEVVFAFLVFLTGAIFSLGYANSLLHLKAPSVSIKALLFDQIRLTAWIVFSVTFLGFLLTPFFNVLRPNLIAYTLPYLGKVPPYYLGGFANYADFYSYFELGSGPLKPSQETVMLVKSSRPAYWRGRVYDYYYGHGWQISDTAREWAYPSPDGFIYLPRRLPTLPGDKKQLISQIFQIRAPLSTTLFAAAEPIAVSFPAQVGLQVDKYNCLHSGFVIFERTSYQVISEQLTANASDLRKLGKFTPTPEMRRFLQIPVTCRRAIRLAREITKNYRNSYDQAKAIAEFLSQNYVYNLRAEPIPFDEDAVDYFLFESKEGYCDMFASAMAIMCRAINIPARLAVGYTTGKWDLEERAYVVRENNAHAWVEVYFPGYGWVIFDPTTGAREPFPIFSALQRVFRAFRWLKRFGFLFPVLLFSFLFAFLTYPPIVKALKKLEERSSSKLVKPRNPRDLIILSYLEICQQLGKIGLMRQHYLTPTEYLDFLRTYLPLYLMRNIQILTDKFIEARYSFHEIGREDVEGLESLLRRLIQSLRKEKKNVKKRRQKA